MIQRVCEFLIIKLACEVEERTELHNKEVQRTRREDYTVAVAHSMKDGLFLDDDLVYELMKQSMPKHTH